MYHFVHLAPLKAQYPLCLGKHLIQNVAETGDDDTQAEPTEAT